MDDLVRYMIDLTVAAELAPAEVMEQAAVMFPERSRAELLAAARIMVMRFREQRGAAEREIENLTRE